MLGLFLSVPNTTKHLPTNEVHPMRITHCIACNKPLTNRRPQTKTCNAACRARQWRHSRITMLPVSFMLNITNYALVKNAANTAGVSIDQFARDHLVQAMEGSPC
ncbi:hypothetical protein D3C75_733410 [compost metagenome]